MGRLHLGDGDPLYWIVTVWAAVATVGALTGWARLGKLQLRGAAETAPAPPAAAAPDPTSRPQPRNARGQFAPRPRESSAQT